MNIALLDEASRSLGITDPSLAVGLSDVAFYSTELPFLNLIKQGGDRHTNDGAWSINVTNADGTVTNYDYSQAWHAGFLDENGYIDNLPEGASASIFFLNSVSAEAQTGGRYVFLYEGEGDFRLNGVSIIEEESAPGRLVVELADGAPFGIIVDSVNSTNPPRDFVLVREEHEGLHEAGAIFNPDFIELFEDHRTLRFMDWMETNHSNIINFADLATADSAFYGIPANQAYEYVFAHEIDELTPEIIAGLSRGGYTPIYVDPQTGEPFRDADTGEIITRVPPELLPDAVPSGVPLEIMIALANQVGADPWFNIPHQATDEFVREFAEMVRDNLDPGLVAHFEFSNETWNGQFEQFSYLNDVGRDVFGDEFGDYPINYYYGYRSAQIQEIINEVFGEEADARTHGVLATQTVNFGVAEQALIGAQRFIADSDDPSKEVSDFFDSLSVTGYFGPTIGEGTAEFPGVAEVFRSWIAESKAKFANGETDNVYQHFIDQAITDLRDSSLTQAYFADALANGEISSIPLSFSVAELRTYFDTNKAIADQFGLDLTQYEGGSHVVTQAALFFDTELQEFINALNGSEEIAQIYEESVDVFRIAGGTLANDFVGVAQQTQFGSFGTLENLNDQTAVFDYYTDYNENAASIYGSINAGRDLSAFQHGANAFGTNADENIIGSNGDDFLSGRGGDDALVGGLGNDGLSGGDGFDRAVFSGLRADYTIVEEDAGFRVTGLDGSDFLVDIEALSFSDEETILVETFLAGASLDVRYHGGAEYVAVSEISNVGFTISAIDLTSQTAIDLGLTTAPERAVDGVYFNAIGIVTAERRETIESGIDNAQGQANFIGNISSIQGSNFNDWFKGYDPAERVSLGNGNDRADGFGGDDTLLGGNGDDTLNGGEGDDLIEAGFGNDSVDGGDGTDVFVLNGVRADYAIEALTTGYEIVGIEGTDFIDNIEFVSFTDGFVISVADWVSGRNLNVDFFDGGTFTPTALTSTGVIIGQITSETVTGDELGIDPDAMRGTLEVFYYVADRGSVEATFEAIHDFGTENARTVAELVGEVGSFNGTEFNDIFEGSEAAEDVHLGDGDDRISGGHGNDLLDGGDGVDFIAGGAGDDTLIGGAGDDTINGGAGEDLIQLNGTVEDYTIEEQGSGYSVVGLDGSDLVFDVERVQFSSGDIILLSAWVENAVSTVENLNGGDFIAAAEPSGVFIAAIVTGTATAADLGVPLNGYESFADTVFYAHALDNLDATYGTIHDGVTGALEVADLVTGVGRIIGSDYDDIFEGSVGDEIVDAGSGNDTLDGFSGADTLYGGNGNDFISGGFDNDVLFGNVGFDTLEGGDGNDSLFGGSYRDILNGGNGDDYIEGGAGFDLIDGGAGNDTLHGGVNPDEIYAGDGNDVVTSGQGADRLFAGAGNDHLESGDGNDLIFGEAGDDTIIGGQGADNIDSGSGADELFGEDGNDRLSSGAGDDLAYGGAGNDFFLSGDGADTLFGGEGNDRVWAGSGNDVIYGGEGNDTLVGYSGFDILIGGEGDDVLDGRFNADRFVFADNFGNDLIRDFDALNRFEKIVLTDVTNIVDYDDLIANHLQVDAEGVVSIVDGVNSVILHGVDVNDLDPTDFIF